MFFLLKKLCDTIGCEKNFFIYGTGYYASEIYKRFCSIGWKNRIKSFVVTSAETRQDTVDNIPVIQFNQSILDDANSIILVAVGETYIEEIRCVLNVIPSDRVLYLWDYRVSPEKKTEILLNASFDDVCDFALDEYIWNNPQSLNEKGELKRKLRESLRERQSKAVQDKSIIYVMEEETARDIKIIRALLEKGYRVAVLQYKLRTQYVAEKELLSMNIVPERFGCMWEFILLSLKYRPGLYFFDIEAFFEYASIAIRNKDIWEKVVIAPYETFMGSFVNISEEIFREEKFCLENADAVVWRFFSKEYLEQKMGYQFKGDSVHLLDNCGGYQLPSGRGERSDERLKLCCVVSQIDNFFREDSSLYARQAKFVDLLNKLDEGCELDVFTWTANENEKYELESLTKKYKNFKYFMRVEHKELIGRISAYDYGLCIYTNENIPDYPMEAEVLADGKMACTEGNYRYSVANRYFDYLDAELPIITTLPEKLCEYLQKYHVIVKMNSSNLDIAYLKANRAYYKERAKEAKQELLMSKQITTLTELFARICSN